jgi:hypothetical protein
MGAVEQKKKMLLQKKWRVAKAVMARAHRALPPPTLEHREQFEGSISRFHEYIDHNELGLAFEELCAAAELVTVEAACGEILSVRLRSWGFMTACHTCAKDFGLLRLEGVRPRLSGPHQMPPRRLDERDGPVRTRRRR